MRKIRLSRLRNQSLMPQFIARVGAFCLYGLLFTGCVGASNWLSGSTESQHSSFDSPLYFAPMRIGVTPVEEISSKFGVPDDVQFGSIEGKQIESLGYSSSAQMTTPFQYIPFFGAVEIWRQGSMHTPSAAISFSPEERVTGLTVSDNNAYGDIRLLRTSLRAGSSSSVYGMNNPAVFHTANASPEHLP